MDTDPITYDISVELHIDGEGTGVPHPAELERIVDEYIRKNYPDILETSVDASYS